MKAWFTAQELALQTLPGLPTTKRKVNEVAAQQGWAERSSATGEKLARPRAGRGGGVEYHYSVLPTPAVAALVARGEVITRTEIVAVPRSEAWAAYDALPDAKKATAAFRLEVLREIEALRRTGHSEMGAVAHVVTLHRARARAGEGAHHEFGASTVANWKKAVRGLNRGDWLPALAPRTQGRTSTADCDPNAWEFLKGDYLRLSQPSFESCIERLQDTAVLNGWALPSPKTLRRRLEREIPAPVMVLAREGYEKLERMFPPIIRDRSEFHALQAVNADGHRWDVFVSFPDKPKPIRPLMLAIQDLYSGKILAWRIAENEGADTVRLAFGDLFRTHGVPDIIWLDNGRGFASKWITGGTPNRFRFKVKSEDPVGVLNALGCDVRFTRPYSGRSKPIERAFRDLCDHGAKHPEFQGAYTGNSPMAKPEDYASRAVPLDVFKAVVGDVIRHHNAKIGRRSRVCRGVLSFDQAYEASVANVLVRKATDGQLRMCLLAHESVTADRLTGAVNLFGNRYWSEFLSEHRGEKVVVRFDPDRLHEEPAHVYSMASQYLGAAELQEAAGFSDAAAAREHGRVKTAWLRSQKAMLELERRLSATDVAALLPDIDEDDGEAPAPAPSTRVVRMIGGLAAAPAAARVVEPTPFIDRYAEALAQQRPDHLRLVE
jgi:transposase InsO family protein